MKLKRLFLGLMAVALAAPAMMAQNSVTLKFEGDGWDKGLYLTNTNEYGTNSGMEYDVYYQPSADTFTYEFSLPFDPDTNTPGLSFGVLKGYTINIEIDNGAGLKNDANYSSDDGNTPADYYLAAITDGVFSAAAPKRVAGMNQFGDAGYSPEIVGGWILSLYTAKVSGHSFTVTVNKEVIDQNEGVNLVFKDFDLYAEPEPLQLTIIGEASGANTGRTYVSSAELASSNGEYFVKFVNSPQQIIVYTEDENFELDFIFTPALEEGNKTYTIKSEKGKYFGMNHTISFYDGARGHTLTITPADGTVDKTPAQVYAAVSKNAIFSAKPATDVVLSKTAPGEYKGTIDTSNGSNVKLYTQKGGETVWYGLAVQTEFDLGSQAAYDGLSLVTGSAQNSVKYMKVVPEEGKTEAQFFVNLNDNKVDIAATAGQSDNNEPKIPGVAEAPEAIYACVVTGALSSYNPQPASDPKLTRGANNVYTGTVAVPSTAYVKYYSVNGTSYNWYGPDGNQEWTFTTDPEMTWTLKSGTAAANVGRIKTGGEGLLENEWPYSLNVSINWDASTLTMTAKEVEYPELPQWYLSIPIEPNMEFVTSFQLHWGAGFDWLPIKWADGSDSKARHNFQVYVPDVDTPFTYPGVIDANVPDDTGDSDGSGGGNYDNSLTILNMFYDGYAWGRPGTYKLIIPAKTFLVEYQGMWIPNKETIVTYQCAGTVMEDSKVVYPFGVDQILEWPRVPWNQEAADADPNYDNYTTGVAFQFPTHRDSNGFQYVLKTDNPDGQVPIQLTIDGKPAGTVYGRITSDVRTQPNRVIVDMSEYTELATYTFTFAKGAVYENESFALGKVQNPGESFTLILTDELNLPGVFFEISGAKNAYEQVVLMDQTAYAYYPTQSLYKIPLNFTADDVYCTLWTKLTPLIVTGPEDLTEGTDFTIYYSEDLNGDNEVVNAAQITFLTEACLNATFKVVAGTETVEEAVTTKFNVTGPEGIVNYLQVVNVSEQEEIVVENGAFSVTYTEFPTQLLLSIHEDYLINVTAPANLATTDYTISRNADADGLTSVTVLLYEACGGTAFNVEIVNNPAGVAGIGAEEGGFTVFNLQGVKVLDTDNASDLNQLQPGLYIVNGKKVVLK